MGLNTLTGSVTAASGMISWTVIVVYGPQEDQAKLQFFGELRWLQQSVCDKWLIVGDFNMILQAADKSNDNLNWRLMGAFRQILQDLSLKELHLRGRKFTWSNNRKQTRIDRAFFTTGWDLMLPDAHLQALSSRTSNHYQLLISKGNHVRLFKGFRFESFWPRLLGFVEVVKAAWEMPVRVTNLFLRLHIKLQRTGKSLRSWARGLIGNNRVLMCAILKLIAILDVA